MRRKASRRRAACFILGTLCCASAQAKIIFTGYADFVNTPDSVFRISGPPSVLNGFGIGSETLESRSNTIDSLGMFATTSISDDARLLMDVNYQGIGSVVKNLNIQYVYLEYSAYGGQADVGKVTLPIGYYNQNRFYPFQRPSISAPTFLSSILGLPISDIGVLVNRGFDMGPLTLTADVYEVNGYGAQPGSTDTFRGAALPGSLTVANNITGSDANHHFAVGGRLALSHKDLSDSSVGVSYYRGDWNPAGNNLLQLGNAHVHLNYAGFELLSEYLYLGVNGDDGMVPNFESQDWHTNGFFTELDYHIPSVWGKPVTPWVRYEDYRSQGAAAGSERLEDLCGGVAVKLHDQITAKAEANHLYYRLPYPDLGDLELNGTSYRIALTVTF